jgi:hypothetical protein
MSTRHLLWIVLASAVVACGGEETDATLVTLEKGADSSIASARTQVVYTQAELAALWADHHPGQLAPTVDFDHEMVIAAFYGFGGGANMEIVSARVSSGNLNVVLAYLVPGPTCVITQNSTYPFHIVRRARDDHPVTFSSTTTVFNC